MCSEYWISNVSTVPGTSRGQQLSTALDPAQTDVGAGRAVPSGTLVQDFSSLCKPHADKTSRVPATVGREQGTRLPGAPMQASVALPARGEAGRARSVLPARRQFRKQRVSV